MARDPLIEEAREHYQKITRLYEETGYKQSYALNPWWSGENMKNMLDIIHGSSNAQEAIHAIQKTWLFSVNSAEPVKERAVDWLLDNQKKNGLDIFKIPETIQESSFSNPQNNVVRGERKFTPDFLRMVSIVHDIQKHCQLPEKRFSVFELGAGCGHLACTFKLLAPHCSYVIVDLPETLFFSYLFLRLNFPKAKFLYVTDKNQIKPGDLEKADFTFIPTLLSNVVVGHPFHLFINTASLGEMPNSVIRHWMDFLQNHLKVRFIFTLNRYLNTIIPISHQYRLEENECSVLYDPHWRMLKWELEPPFTRCPYVDTIIARYVEIIAERDYSPSPETKKIMSQQLLNEVKNQDWFRLEKSLAPEMTCRDNILVHDMTINGTLFKLWESIRLDANLSNVAVLLKYLDTLLRDPSKEFEETFYYEKIFEVLFQKRKNQEWHDVRLHIIEKRQSRKEFPLLQYDSLVKLMETLPPMIVQENYKGFNIVLYKRTYYAVDQTLSEIDFHRPDLAEIMGQYCRDSRCRIGATLDQVREVVDQVILNYPRLVENDYKGFNIILIGEMSYAIDQTLGEIDFDRPDLAEIMGQYCRDSRCRVGHTLDQVKEAVDQLILNRPTIVEENYKGFNIVSYQDRYYALAQVLGPVDLKRPETEALLMEQWLRESKCVANVSLDKVKRSIDALVVETTAGGLKTK